MKEISIFFKAPDLLDEYLTASGKILSRPNTQLTSKDQRIIKKAIKTARILGLFGYSTR